jgi:anti-sigma factor (TIGR02949 family)
LLLWQMDCAKARFLLYAYLDRELSSGEAEALARHLADCSRCETRAQAARGLAQLLRSRVDRAAVPHRLRLRLQQLTEPVVRPRYPAFAMAAAILLMILPLVTDESLRGGRGVARAGLGPAGPASKPSLLLSRRVTGTLVCLHCEARHEAGLCPLPEGRHEPALCADDGEVWRLMARDPSFGPVSAGQTVTVEGIAFPQSGFLRASRVGY